MSIKAELSEDKKQLTITVEGRFDFSLLQSFKETYDSLEPQPEAYIVDLKQSDYLDSSALGMLLALRDYAGGESANIRIINCNAEVKKILLVTKLDELFKVE